MTAIFNILEYCTITPRNEIDGKRKQQDVVTKNHDAIYSTLKGSKYIILTVLREGKPIELELTKDENGKFGFEITRTRDSLTVSRSYNTELQIGDRIINAVSEGDGISNSGDKGIYSIRCFLDAAQKNTKEMEALFRQLETKWYQHQQFSYTMDLEHQRWMSEHQRWMSEHGNNNSSNQLGPLGQQHYVAHGLEFEIALYPPKGPQ